ncbi:hypothetical protein PGT21_007239 [Puccinia graminis f. sp. tritici]|uniref:Uncharacterized protein n=1 Tax=Puccinia graminis f. sp. tritici TaxID=56615 RepID=A0A5B0MBC2_PUCGR|nr:hypothetical protein PGT21_007239 [Puccinia graminis f. sp. tritici]
MDGADKTCKIRARFRQFCPSAFQSERYIIQRIQRMTGYSMFGSKGVSLDLAGEDVMGTNPMGRDKAGFIVFSTPLASCPRDTWQLVLKDDEPCECQTRPKLGPRRSTCCRPVGHEAGLDLSRLIAFTSCCRFSGAASGSPQTRFRFTEISLVTSVERKHLLW